MQFRILSNYRYDLDGMVALLSAGAWAWGLSVGRSNGNRVGYVKCNVLAHNFLTHKIVAEDVIYWQHNLAEF